MGIGYRLAAFDRQTEERIGSDAIPDQIVSEIRKIAQIPAADDGAGDYPLNAAQAYKIAARLGIKVHPESLDYFIEPYVEKTSGVRQK
jgi:hypothetical protein